MQVRNFSFKFYVISSNYLSILVQIRSTMKRVLAREGATVIAADRKLGEAKETIRLMNRDGLALNLDVSSSMSVSSTPLPGFTEVEEQYQRIPDNYSRSINL